MLVLLGFPTVTQAYRGDNPVGVVVDQQTGSLTSEAQEFLKNYDSTLDKKWIDVGSKAVNDNAVFKTRLVGRFLPFAGRVIPVVAGALTAYEVCSAYVHNGCWLFERNDTDLQPLVPNDPVWQYIPSVPADGLPMGGAGSLLPVPSLANASDLFILRWNNGPYYFNDTRYGATNCIQFGPTTHNFGGHTAPTAVTPNAFRCWIGYYENSEPYAGTVFWKGAMEGAMVRAPAADDPAVPNATWNNSQPGDSNWAHSVPEGLTQRQRDAMCWLMRPDLCDNPYTTTVPDCPSLTFTTCSQRLRDAGIDGTITRQIKTFAEADATKPADAALSTSPAKNATVDRDATVVITTNPADADMPRLIPQPTSHETGSIYSARLRTLGLIPDERVVKQTPGNSWAGDVLSTTPIAGSRVRRDTSVQTQSAWRPATLNAQDESQDPSCEPSLPRYVPPGTRGRFTPGTPPKFNSIDGSVSLWWGALINAPQGWGEVHIVNKHGWADQDRADTAATLITPTVRLRDRPDARAMEPYFYAKDMSSRKGKLCERIVRVDRGTWPGEPQMRGVITSFGAVRGTL